MESPRGPTELSAAESLAVIEQQRARVDRELDVNPAVLYAAWGVAWALGFTALALHASDVMQAQGWAVGSVFAGLPANYVVLAVAGGGGFLVAAVWFALHRRQGVPA